MQWDGQVGTERLTDLAILWGQRRDKVTKSFNVWREKQGRTKLFIEVLVSTQAEAQTIQGAEAQTLQGPDAQALCRHPP